VHIFLLDIEDHGEGTTVEDTPFEWQSKPHAGSSHLRAVLGERTVHRLDFSDETKRDMHSGPLGVVRTCASASPKLLRR
jgi:hypothetical protein